MYAHAQQLLSGFWSGPIGYAINKHNYTLGPQSGDTQFPWDHFFIYIKNTIYIFHSHPARDTDGHVHLPHLFPHAKQKDKG